MYDLSENIDGIDIRYRYKPALQDNNSLIIVFSGFGKNGGFTYDFRNALNLLNSAIIWIEDSLEDNISYYLGKGISDKIQNIIYGFIQNKIKELNLKKEQCILLGCSKGGSAALYYGTKFGFEHIVVTVPQFKIYSYLAGDIPDWKGHPNVLKHLVTTELDKKKLDDVISNVISNDIVLSKNIYLITSSKDDQYLGQVDPFIALLKKYKNFNLLMSESICVNKHTDVTKYNAQVVVGLLALLEKNIYPQIGNISYQGRTTKENFVPDTPDLILETSKIFFQDNKFFIEGYGFFKGISCQKWEDINYALHLEGNNKIETISLAKTSKKSTTQKFAGKSRVNYDKANFCTNKHEGLELSELPKGIYRLKISVKNFLYEKSDLVIFEGLERKISKNKRFCVYEKNREIFLSIDEVDLEWENNFIDNVKNKFGNVVKSWLYKDNFVANHFDVHGYKFIVDVVKTKEEFSCYFFDKERFFLESIENFFVERNIAYKVDKNKIRLDFSSLNYLDIHMVLENYFQFIKKNFDEKFFFEALKEVHQKKIEIIKNKESIVVGFLVSDLRKWNLDAFFKILKKQKKITPRIILLKEKIVDSIKDERYLEQYGYFKNIDSNLIERESLSHFEFSKKITQDVDIIFYQQPWDGMSYWIQKLYKNVLSCYIPYSYIIYDSPLDYSINGFHKYLWKYFSQSIEHTKTHLKYEPNHRDKIDVIGYPKLDIYRETSITQPFFLKFGKTEKKKIIYAPHHSFKGSALQIATFSWNSHIIKSLKDRKDSLWCLKPHGRFRYSVIENNIMTESEIDKYILQWSQGGSFIYDQGDYFDLFKNSDILITDCSSFLAEYFPTGKPIVWLKSDISKVEFNDFGELISKGFYIAENENELIEIYEKLVVMNLDPLKETRRNIIEKVFNFEDSSSEKLYNILINILKNGD